MIKTVLFDIDGTLLDTSEFILQAFEYSLKLNGITEIERKHIVERLGPSLFEMYKLLTPNINTELLVKTHRDFQNENLHLSKAFPGADETLEALKDMELKIAAVTTRSNQNSIHTLELAGIKKYFDMIISFEDVKKPKPDPEGILKVLDTFKLKPEHAIMVGDTSVDIEAGKNAGTVTVGITHGMKGEDVKKSKPDYLISSIPELLELF